MEKKIFKLQSSISDISNKPPSLQHLPSLDLEWENLEKSKQTFKEQVDRFMQDRERLEKDLLEFRTCKEA